MRTRVKICGITGAADAGLAVEAGADAVGFIFAPSPRRISIDAAAEIAASLPAFVTPVGVFVDPVHEEVAHARDRIPRLAVQLHGKESPAFAQSCGAGTIKAVPVDQGGAVHETLARANAFDGVTLLFDTQAETLGGTGIPFAWETLREVARTRRIVIAGGLNASNVGSCIAQVRPFGVDVRSGVERDGRKDRDRLRAFMDAVRTADAA